MQEHIHEKRKETMIRLTEKDEKKEEGVKDSHEEGKCDKVFLETKMRRKGKTYF